jgi:ABC-type oligopeptide transport system ATPase subunit
MKYESIQTAYQTDDEFRESSDSMYKQKFKSGLKLFQDHNGFIDGELHTFIGTKGSGKSTWSKTILTDLAYQEKGVLLYISEERKNKYLNTLNKAFRISRATPAETKKYLDNIIVVGELDDEITDVEVFFATIEKLVDTCELDIVIFDNFTTSFLSELPINQQSAVLRRIKQLADKLNIPILMFFHTGKLADPKRLDGDNIRGSATAINIGSYNYLISQHKTALATRNFVYTEKARYHARANKKMYEIIYEHDVGIFTSCKDIELHEYKSIIDGKAYENKGGFK